MWKEPETTKDFLRSISKVVLGAVTSFASDLDLQKAVRKNIWRDAKWCTCQLRTPVRKLFPNEDWAEAHLALRKPAPAAPTGLSGVSGGDLARFMLQNMVIGLVIGSCH